MVSGKPCSENERRPGAADPREDAARIRGDGAGREAGEEIGKVGHRSSFARLPLQSTERVTRLLFPPTARQPMSRRQKPPGQSIASTAA